MNAARRLSRFRAALVAFVFMTVLLAFLGLPMISQIAHRQTVAVGWIPAEGAPFVAIGILLTWWGSLIAVWATEERRLYAIRRKAGVR